MVATAGSICHSVPVQDAGRIRPAGALARWRDEALAFAAISVVYFMVFAFSREQPIADLLAATARNVISLALTSAAARPLARRFFAWPFARQLPAHACLAIGFSLVWLWLLTVTGALLGAESLLRFTVNPFLVGPAATWQLLQGVFAYGLLAALLALQARPAPFTGLIVVNDQAGKAPEHFLLRAEDGMAPLPASRIVSIAGADDYTELVTLDGVQLVQTRLAQFEQQLDPARFLRVHRSAIVNLDRLVRAEPAGGGRMVLVMETGPDIPASRAGAKALRERLL